MLKSLVRASPRQVLGALGDNLPAPSNFAFARIDEAVSRPPRPARRIPSCHSVSRDLSRPAGQALVQPVHGLTCLVTFTCLDRLRQRLGRATCAPMCWRCLMGASPASLCATQNLTFATARRKSDRVGVRAAQGGRIGRLPWRRRE